MEGYVGYFPSLFALLTPKFLLTVSIILLQAIAVSTTILRIIHRFRMRKAWWDDYILFIPLVFNLAYWVVFCWGYSQPSAFPIPIPTQ